MSGWLAVLAELLQLCCRDKLSDLRGEFELSDAEVSNMFPHLAELLDCTIPTLVVRIRPRWELYQSLLGERDVPTSLCAVAGPCIVA